MAGDNTDGRAEEERTDEVVDHPLHYGGKEDPYEAIKVIEAWSPTWPQGAPVFHLGNVVKYVSRAGRKGARLADLRKARWYLDRAIQFLEARQ